MEVITTHTNSDFDTIASMVAAKRLYPDARLVFPGSLEKGLRDSLAAIEALGLPCRFERVRDIEMDEVERLIIVDIRHASRIGVFEEIIGRPGLDVHIYDHHPRTESDIKGSVDVYKKYGSTTTILTHLLMKKGIEITPAEATVMMTGIYEDTGSLTYPSTTVKDYEAAAFLLKRGADLTRAAEFLRKEMTAYEVEALSELIESETTYTVSGVDVVIAEARAEKYKGDISTLAHRLRDIEGLRCLFLLADMGDRVHVVARSAVKRLDAGAVARHLGGGGHRAAAAATLKGATLIEARERLIAALKETVEPEQYASDIMSAPALTVDSAATVKEALKIMRRFSVNALPVVKDGKGAGVITRQVVSKAFYHGLGTDPVEDYMTTDVEWVTSTTPVDEIREIAIAHGQRLLPVKDDGVVAGVITRTDILKLLQDELRERPSEEALKKRSLKSLMNERLPGWTRRILAEAGETAAELGYGAYVVGGFVRDMLLGRENLDIDIVIEGGGEGDGVSFAKAFAGKHGLRVRAHERFKTAVLIYPDGFKMDVATARLEYYKKPGALPTIEKSSLKLDLFRRDFTINTLAVDITPKKFGVLIDFFGGQRDIKEKTIRALHNLSFVEDPTRALRAVRFSERFGFKIGAHTLNLIKKTVKVDKFGKLPGSRLRDELVNILGEDHAPAALASLKRLGVLGLIHPSIEWDDERERLFEAAREAVAWHRLLFTDEKAEEWLTLFLALTSPLSETELRSLTTRLAVSGKLRLAVIGARGEGLKALAAIKTGRINKGSRLYSLLDPLPLETTLYVMSRATTEAARESISTYITKLRGASALLKGRDLQKMGVEEGPRIGEILDKLLKKKLDGEVSTREDEMEAARKLAGRRG